jgi:hypothetical protein
MSHELPNGWVSQLRHPAGESPGARASEAALSEGAVIARSGKLDQVKSVTERVRHIRHPSVVAALYATVERGGETHFGIEIGDDEVEMHRRPVPREIAAPPDIPTGSLPDPAASECGDGDWHWP